MKKAFLILADGSVFEGQSIGIEGVSIGETVFTTGMTGYLETLTDPSYFGQIVTQTFPLIGNYGLIPEDFESRKSCVRGYVVRELCEKPSNFRCQASLDSFLKKEKIVGICGIDTRALTKRLREAGVMNGMIMTCESLPKIDESFLKKIRDYKIENAVESVSCSQLQVSENKTESMKIGLWDFGAKANIKRELEKRGAQVLVLPYSTDAEKIIDLKLDGLMLSNGPGDPSDNIGIIKEIKKICDYDKNNEKGKVIPIFGICLGHQMLALARGAKTSKLKYGHRGGNHPVKDLESGRIYISSQNHGYAVENDTLPPYAKLAFINSNDKTCEGIRYTDIPAYSVQFHPEACGGPHDTNFLFDRFMDMIKENSRCL
ncbi:MAG: carbamoyl phosphate synthase small subunit [Treponemataceae bacterium]|nr:carbamoyl phosphate synthase small subunit [Treponemataceae bacterium]